MSLEDNSPPVEVNGNKYVIKWEHRLKKTMGRSRKVLGLKEAMELCRELNNEYGMEILHWIDEI